MQQRFVLVGIGGTGMSGLAQLLYDLDYPDILGIDSSESEITEHLQQKGISVVIGHGTVHITPNDIVIYSAAAANSPEVETARQQAIASKHRRLPFLYHQFLGELSKYFYTIAITGTHGKSTTTALLGTTLSQHHPRFALGMVGASVTQRHQENYFLAPDHKATVHRIVDHIISPKSPPVTDIMKTLLFVVEADEYNKHFLRYDPDEAIITNVDYDHMDIYPTPEAYQKTFLAFATKIKHHLYVLPTAGNELLFSHLPTYTPVSSTTFAFSHLLGGHNHENASLALAAAQQQFRPNEQLISSDILKKTLSHFIGLRRRAETLGFNHHGVRIISDYGHHPAELKSTLAAVHQTYPHEHITCIFQPHQARRVIEFRKEFADAVQSVPTVIYSLYAAREDIPMLLKDYGRVFSSHEKAITTADELGNAFAITCGGTYTTDIQEIIKTITTTTQGVIIIFTAGDLDFLIRKAIASGMLPLLQQ